MFFCPTGGPLTVTDANLALGRLLPSFFPYIFGPGENEPISIDETMRDFQKLTKDINHFLSTSQSQFDEDNRTNSDVSESDKSEMSVEEVAMGFIRVANEAMCRPIRALTQVEICWSCSCDFCYIFHEETRTLRFVATSSGQ